MEFRDHDVYEVAAVSLISGPSIVTIKESWEILEGKVTCVYAKKPVIRRLEPQTRHNEVTLAFQCEVL